MIFSSQRATILKEIQKNQKVMDKIKKSNPHNYTGLKEWIALDERNVLLTEQFNELN